MFGLKSEHFYALGFVLALSSAVLTAYWSILSTEDAAKVTMAAYEARLGIVEKLAAQAHEEDQRFAAEMRSTLNQISNNVADLRVLEASRTKK